VIGMAASAWAPAVGATLAAAIAFGSAVWVQVRAWKQHHRTRWDELTLNTYAAFLQEASAAYDAAILIGMNRPSPSLKCTKQFKKHYAAIEARYEVLVLLAPPSHEQARRMMWTLWNLGEQKLPQSQDLSLATRIYRDARYHLRVEAQDRFNLHVSDLALESECDPDAHESILARPHLDLLD
jgi:hypothetical protein